MSLFESNTFSFEQPEVSLDLTGVGLFNKDIQVCITLSYINLLKFHL